MVKFHFLKQLTVCIYIFFVRIVSLLRSSKSPLDLSQSLRFLQRVVTKSEKPNFSLFQQQDVAEILPCIFEEFFVESLHA